MEGNIRSRFCAISLILAATVSTSAIAQITSTSGSDSTANSGSVSGAASQSNPTNINAPVNSQGNLSSTSGSESNANSASVSGSTSTSAGQTSTNQQGVSLTFNSHTPRTQKVFTNNAVPLAASSSFSSDYCGGTASGGASAAPIGISIGGSGPVFDKSCQSLRRAEKFGMAAANAHNLGQPELAGKLMSMMIWSICTSDSGGPKADKATAKACDTAGLLGSTTTAQVEPAPAAEPAVRTAANAPTPEAASRQPAMASVDPKIEMVVK